MFVSLLRTLILYICIVISLRVMGKRQIGELQPSELVVTLLISNIAAVPMQDMGIPLSSGLIPIATLVVIELFLAFIMLKSNGFRNLVAGKPITVIKDGKLLLDQMARVSMSIEDLMEDMRQAGTFFIEDISYAIVETNGKLSIFPKPQKAPVTPEQMKLPVTNDGISVILISDGKLAKNSMDFYDVDAKWVSDTLKKENTSMEDVFIMTVNKAMKYQIIRKNESGGKA